MLSLKLPYTGGGCLTTLLFLPRGVVSSTSTGPSRIGTGFSETGSANGSTEAVVSLLEDVEVADLLGEPCQSRCRASLDFRRFSSINRRMKLWRKTPAKARMNNTERMWNMSPCAVPVTARAMSALCQLIKIRIVSARDLHVMIAAMAVMPNAMLSRFLASIL